MIFARPFLAAGLAGLLAVAGMSGTDAQAQQIYRIVGPDGRVTFSDQPPLQASANAKPAPNVPMPGASTTGTTDNLTLPFELRQATTRYPVTLYTSGDCKPCGSARGLLSGRGIPYTEKTVSTNEDIEALKRLSGGASVPFLTIGGQQLRGFTETEWIQYLDAAGYPKTSLLPAGYSAPAATPLAVIQQAQPPVAAAPEAPRAPANPLPAAEPAAANPSGIKF